MRQIIDLNFGWRLCPGFRQEYVRTDFRDNTFRQVDIPHTVYDAPGYEYYADSGAGDTSGGEKKSASVFCYRKHFILPYEMKDKRLLLTFDGVMGCAAVFINGKHVCAHRGGFTPFTCEITGMVSPYINNGDNLIAVVVDCSERADTYPFGDMSQPSARGGIYREVRIEAVDSVYVKSARVIPIYENDSWFLDISGELSDRKSTEIRIYLDASGNRIFGKYILVENAAFGYRMPITAGIEEWTPENPKLYKLLITTADTEEYALRFGFRQAQFRQDGFYLNGRKIRLIGLERTGNFSRLGAALPEYAQRSDAELLKRLGCNFARTGQTPPSPRFLDACDELGIMVFEELPGRGGIYSANYADALRVTENARSADPARGPDTVRGTDAGRNTGGIYSANDMSAANRGTPESGEWRENMLAAARELIARDRHHPSIVLWGTRPEDAPENDNIYIDTYRIAMELDGSRQTAAVRSISEIKGSPRSEPAEDVCAVNDYSAGHSGNGLEKRKNVTKTKQPYLAAGFSGMSFPAGSADGEILLTEQALLHAAALDSAYGDPDICGIIGKSLCDYESRPLMGSSDNMCLCGVTDEMRVPKPAAYVYESQQEGHTVLELCSSLYPTDIKAAGTLRSALYGNAGAQGAYGVYCYTNCERVELYRNGRFTASFLPDRKRFPHLPHPPVFIDDFIGNLLVSEERVDPKDAPAVKSALVSMLPDGDIPTEARKRAACALTKNRYTPARLGELYNKYYSCRFGGAVFRLDGITGGKVLASIVSAPVTKTGIRVKCDRSELVSGVTYDCARIELTAVDQNGQRLWRNSDAVSVSCEGSVDVIGPKLFSLKAGAYAFYVRTKGGKGEAAVNIVTESLGSHTVSLSVTRAR